MDEMFLFAIFALVWFFGTRVLISLAIIVPATYLVIWYLNRSGHHIVIKARWIILAGITIGIIIGWISWECL
ncbi:hypothetical protein ES708_31958 [subsurface metagenome]